MRFWSWLRSKFAALGQAFQGKKTYVSAGVLFALGVFALWDADKTNDFVGMALFVLAFGLLGLRSHAQRNAEFVAHEISDLKALLTQPGPRRYQAYLTDLVQDLMKFGILQSPPGGVDDAAAGTGGVQPARTGAACQFCGGDGKSCCDAQRQINQETGK